MTRDLTPAVEALAARVGVRIQRGRNPGDPAFPWSFHAGENDRPADMHIVGPGVVYVRPDALVTADLPAWAVLLHEVGHAATGSADESIVAGWTDAAARSLGRGALRVMRRYDRETLETLPATNRRRAIRAGVLDAAGRVVETPRSAVKSGPGSTIGVGVVSPDPGNGPGANAARESGGHPSYVLPPTPPDPWDDPECISFVRSAESRAGTGESCYGWSAGSGGSDRLPTLGTSRTVGRPGCTCSTADGRAGRSVS